MPPHMSRGICDFHGEGVLAATDTLQHVMDETWEDVFLSFSKGKMSNTSKVVEEQQIMIFFGIPPSFQKMDYMRSHVAQERRSPPIK